MKLTDQNIQDLYTFTRQHFVEYYDVQNELVDHLANDIEQICKEQPNLTFEQARTISFKKFGVFGFLEVVEEKQKQVTKKYRKIIWSFLKEWFKLPKLIITLSAILFFYYVFQIPKIGIYVFHGLQLILFVFLIIKIYLLNRLYKQKTKKTGKKWLLEYIIFRLASSSLLVWFSNVYNIFRIQDVFYRLEIVLLASILMVLLILVGYISLYLIPKRSEDLLKKHYPEYQFI